MSGLIERNPFVNLSEWHLGYFTYNGDYPMDMYDSSSSSDAFYSKGGSASFATATLSRWNGPVSESLVSYGSTDVDDSLNYASEYHLTDAVCMNSSLNDNIMYNNYQNNIKSIVLSGKSVMVSLYYKYNLYYSKAGNSYYCNDSSLTINHGVTIVGWDDDFDNFDGLENQPTSKGAWLVKNTYGYQFGDYGYFWLSYENVLKSDMTAFTVDSNENYSTNYTLDPYGWTTSINSLTNERGNTHTDYAGNVFTSSNGEDLTAVGIYTTDYKTSYTVYIYKNLKSDSPVGDLVESFSGTEQYSGYHTIDLPTPVSLDTGEKFSVVVKYKNPNYTDTVAVESSVTFFNVSNGEINITQNNLDTSTILASCSAGESFVSNDGKTWRATRGKQGLITESDSDFNYVDSIDLNSLDDGYYAISTLGNACIKAFTNPHDKVYFSQYGGNLYLGETIELSNPVSGATIYYTLDGTTPTLDSQKYTAPITFEGEDLTITARTCIDGVLGEPYTETFTQLDSVLTTLCLKEIKGTKTLYTELNISDGTVANTELEYTCDDTTQTVELFPISCGNIVIGDEEVTSGHETEITIGDSDETVIPIYVSKDGCNSTEYTLTIKKNVTDSETTTTTTTTTTEPEPETTTTTTTITTTEPEPETTTTTTTTPDDNSNPDTNVFNYTDILLLKRYLLNTVDCPSYDDIATFDINLDDKIDTLDLILMKREILSNASDIEG
jgi:hypothetical protein